MKEREGEIVPCGMEKHIDLESWDRRESYERFKDFVDPYFGVVVNLDISPLWEYCKTWGIGINHALLYAVVKTANAYGPIKMRRRGEGVVELAHINIGTSILRKGSEGFSFAFYEYRDGMTLEEFDAMGREASAHIAGGGAINPKLLGDDVIRGTTVPWISFSGFKHAVRGTDHSIPRIVLGGISEQNGRRVLPFQIEVDHALMDGLHLSQYLDVLQEELLKDRG